MRSGAARRGLPVVTYELAPRKDALIFGREFAAPDMVMDGLADDQAAHPLSPHEAGALDALLGGRISGESAHERYFDGSLGHEADAVRAALGLPSGSLVVSAFTNLSWDTALLGKDVAFDSQFDWLAETCRIVGSRDDTTLVIRVHPAEGRWGPRSRSSTSSPNALGGCRATSCSCPRTDRSARTASSTSATSCSVTRRPSDSRRRSAGLPSRLRRTPTTAAAASRRTSRRVPISSA